MMDFPKIFTPAMKHLRDTQKKYEDLVGVDFYPRILINVDYDSIRKEIRKTDVIKQVDLYTLFWIEDQENGYLCKFNADTYVLVISVCNRKGVIQDLFKHRADDEGMFSRVNLRPDRLVHFNFVLSVMALMTMHKAGTKISTFTATRNKASVYYAEGDDLKFKRIFDLKRLPSPQYQKPEPGSSGIRKKEHPVIGHYRTYKSGVKVWVKPHKRGDPSLGSVTSVFT